MMGRQMIPGMMTPQGMMGQRPPMMNNKADGDGTNDYLPEPAGGQGLGGGDTGPPVTSDGPGMTLTGGGANGPGGFMSNLGNIFGDQMNNFSGALSNPLMIPSLAAAMQQFHQSRQYTDMAENYAGQLDPFGKQRSHYQDLMRQSYDDPEAVLNDPAHMRSLQHGLSAVGDAGAAKGLLGSSGMAGNLMDYARTSDDKWLNDYRQGLSPLTGAQFGPQTAGHMLEMGLQGRMGAENNAVGNLMLPFMNQSRGNTINNTNGGPGGGAGNYAQQAANLLKNPSNLPANMRNWSPQQLTSWLQHNQALGNDSWGNWLSGNQGGDGGIGADTGIWRGSGMFDSNGQPWNPDDMSGWMGSGGGGADWQMGMGGDGGMGGFDTSGWDGSGIDWSNAGDFWNFGG